MTRQSKTFKDSSLCQAQITELRQKLFTSIDSGLKKASNLIGDVKKVGGDADKAKGQWRIRWINEMRILVRSTTFWIVIILGVTVLYPFQSTIVPAQNVLVVTEDWRPIEDASVRQIWQHYSLESRSHEEDLRTGPDGRLTFPRRTIRASLLRRMAYPIRILLAQGVHASFGVHTDMFLVAGVAQNRIGQGVVEAKTGDVVFRIR